MQNVYEGKIQEKCEEGKGERRGKKEGGGEKMRKKKRMRDSPYPGGE